MWLGNKNIMDYLELNGLIPVKYTENEAYYTKSKKLYSLLESYHIR